MDRTSSNEMIDSDGLPERNSSCSASDASNFRRPHSSAGGQVWEERLSMVPRIVHGRGKRLPHRASSPSMLSYDASAEDDCIEEVRQGRFYHHRHPMDDDGAISMISEELVLRFLERKGMLEAKQQLEQILEKEKMACVEAAVCHNCEGSHNASPSKSLDGHDTMITLDTQYTSSISTTVLGRGRSRSCSDVRLLAIQCHLEDSGSGSTSASRRCQSVQANCAVHRSNDVIPYFCTPRTRFTFDSTPDKRSTLTSSSIDIPKQYANSSRQNFLDANASLALGDNNCSANHPSKTVSLSLADDLDDRAVVVNSPLSNHKVHSSQNVEYEGFKKLPLSHGQKRSNGLARENFSQNISYSSGCSAVSDISDLPSGADMQIVPLHQGSSRSLDDRTKALCLSGALSKEQQQNTRPEFHANNENLPSKKELDDAVLATAYAMSLLDKKQSSSHSVSPGTVPVPHRSEEDEAGLTGAAHVDDSNFESPSEKTESSGKAKKPAHAETRNSLPSKEQLEDSALATATVMSYLDQKPLVSHAASPGAVSVPFHPESFPPSFTNRPTSESDLAGEAAKMEDKHGNDVIEGQSAQAVNHESSCEREKVLDEETRMADDNALIMGIVTSEMAAKVADVESNDLELENVDESCSTDSSSQAGSSDDENSSSSSASYDFSLTGGSMNHAEDDVEVGSVGIQNVSHIIEPTATMVECAPVQAQVLNTVDAVLVEKPEPEDVRCKTPKRKRAFTVISLLLLALAIVVLVVLLVLRRRDRVAKEYSLKQRRQYILNIISKLTNETQILNSSTSQHDVFQWISESGIGPENPPHQVEQRFALGMLYHSLGGAGWTDKFHFMSQQNECLWNEGAVACNKDGKVVKVSLANNNLTGRLPSEIFGLRNLQELWLGDNDVKGQIPSVLGANVTELRVLSLHDNSMTGTIPESLYDLNLEILILDENSFHGTISPHIFNQRSLSQLGLYANNFEGTICTDFGKLQNLTSLALFRNKFRGTIPTEIGNLRKLENLQISDNLLVGNIPEELGHLPKLWRMSLSYNDLTGTVPRSFANLSSLDRLYLQSTLIVDNLTFICEAFSDLDVFRADLREVTCPCCQCCE